MGTVIAWFFIILLLLLLLVLFVPATVYIDLRHGSFSVKFRLLFVKLGIFPFKEKKARVKKEKKKRPKKKKAAKDKAEKDMPEKEKSRSEKIAFIKRLIRSGETGLKYILKHLYIWDIDLLLPVSGEDAALTAKNCAGAQAVIGTGRALLENTPLHLKYKRLYVLADYGNQYGEALSFSCKVSVSPVIILIAGVKAFIKFLSRK